MCVSIRRLVIVALLALAAPACFEPSAVDEDARPQDSSLDQPRSDTLPLDGPRGDGKKPDGPVADFNSADLAPPDGPGPDKLLPKPDTGVCTAVKTVWDKFKWDEGCLWQ